MSEWSERHEEHHEEHHSGHSVDADGGGSGWSELLVAAALAAVLGVAGAGLAWVWRSLAPAVTVVVTPYGPALTDQHTEAFIATDGVFGAVGVGAGIVFGVLSFTLRRWRGPVLLVGLALGCLAASWVCSRLGAELGRSGYEQLLDRADVGRRLEVPVRLRAQGMLLLQPLVAVATYVLGAAWSRSSDLGVAATTHEQPTPANPLPTRYPPASIGRFEGRSAGGPHAPERTAGRDV